MTDTSSTHGDPSGGRTRLRPAVADALAAAGFALVAFASLQHLWRADGWPINHEYTTSAIRTLVYVRHFSWLDLLPIWSTADSLGFGSP